MTKLKELAVGLLKPLAAGIKVGRDSMSVRLSEGSCAEDAKNIFDALRLMVPRQDNGVVSSSYTNDPVFSFDSSTSEMTLKMSGSPQVSQGNVLLEPSVNIRKLASEMANNGVNFPGSERFLDKEKSSH